MLRVARRNAGLAREEDAGMAYFKSAAICLTLALVTGNAIAAPTGTEKAAIEKAYATRVAAETQADIEQRIAARWQALANDPASPVIGGSNAPSSNTDVTIVEFFDYTCPYCKAAEPRLEALLKSDPKVRLVLKEYPILTPQSLIASRAALAATAQGKYTAYHNSMMRFEGRLTETDIFDMAKASGLDVARLKRDMNAPSISDQIIAVFNLARGIRAFQTPTYIVNGRLLSSESASIDFRKEVAAARRK
jgi:protein-disulfide isomerase